MSSRFRQCGALKKVLSGLGVLLVVVIPQVAGAPPGAFTPPYDDSSVFEDCGGFDAETVCDAVADHQTGVMQATVSVTGPLGGLLPGFGNSFAEARIVEDDIALRGPPQPQVALTVTVHVNNAQADHSGLINAIFGGDNGGFATAGLFAQASHAQCADCFGFGGIDEAVVDTNPDFGPPERMDEDLVFDVVLVNGAGGNVPGGDLTIDVFLGASATLDDNGSVGATVDAVLSSIQLAGGPGGPPQTQSRPARLPAR